MNRHAIRLLPIAFALGASALLPSCATWAVPNPNAISLEEATASLGRSLVEMKKAQIEANNNKDFRTGLVPSEAEVTFKISAAGSDGRELMVDLSPSAGAVPFTGKLFGKLTGARESARSNLVTIKFKNIVFEQTNPLLNQTIAAMEGAGISPSAKPRQSTAVEGGPAPDIGGGLQIFQHRREFRDR